MDSRREILSLQNPVRHYAWGSGVHIPRLLGEDPGGQPWAEMWLGAHPSGPSCLMDGTRLDDAIRADPVGMLGGRVAGSFGRLPFLMKLLAAGEPLSLQVHPSSEQARLAYALQETGTAPGGLVTRSYSDTSHKPELIYALTRFEGMAGFRDIGRTVAILRELRLPWSDDLAKRLDGTDTPFQTVRELVSDILGWQGSGLFRRLADLRASAAQAEARLHIPPSRRRPPTQAAESIARESLRVFQQTQQLVSRYPKDPGVVVTLLLNHVVLAAGDAMFVPAGMIHAYTSGFGVEIMASSDNVLRAGLTSKHIDVPELLRITDFNPSPPARWAAAENGNVRVFSPPVGEFELAVMQGPCRVEVGPGPAIVLCLQGEAAVRTVSEHALLRQGESVYLRAAQATVEARTGLVAVGRYPAA